MLRLSCSLQFGETFLDSKLKKFFTTGSQGSQGYQGDQGYQGIQGSRFKVEKIFAISYWFGVGLVLMIYTSC